MEEFGPAREKVEMPIPDREAFVRLILDIRRDASVSLESFTARLDYFGDHEIDLSLFSIEGSRRLLRQEQ